MELGRPEGGICVRVAQSSGAAAAQEVPPREGEEVHLGDEGGASPKHGRDPKRWPTAHTSSQRQEGSRKKRRSRTAPAADGNAELCTGCRGEGGGLYCCDMCPRVWHTACIQKRGGVVQVPKGRWHGPCCAEQRRARQHWQCQRSGGGGRVEPEPKEADKEAGAQAPDQGVLRYEYTGKRSERSAYIAERAKLAHGLTQAEVLQLQYPGREGLMLRYKEEDLRYDMDHGYLRKRGAASKGASGWGAESLRWQPAPSKVGQGQDGE